MVKRRRPGGKIGILKYWEVGDEQMRKWCKREDRIMDT
jgi:hypothetical protein